MAVLSSKSFDIVNQKIRQQKGPIIRVELAPGRFVKMYREDAIAAGHIAPPNPPRGGEGEKNKPAAENKMLPAAENKTADAPKVEADFTTIPGVGPATARALKTRGIKTFDALRAAGQLDFVSPQAMAAIEKWRQGSGSD